MSDSDVDGEETRPTYVDIKTEDTDDGDRIEAVGSSSKVYPELKKVHKDIMEIGFVDKYLLTLRDTVVDFACRKRDRMEVLQDFIRHLEQENIVDSKDEEAEKQVVESLNKSLEIFSSEVGEAVRKYYSIHAATPMDPAQVVTEHQVNDIREKLRHLVLKKEYEVIQLRKRLQKQDLIIEHVKETLQQEIADLKEQNHRLTLNAGGVYEEQRPKSSGVESGSEAEDGSNWNESEAAEIKRKEVERVLSQYHSHFFSLFDVLNFVTENSLTEEHVQETITNLRSEFNRQILIQANLDKARAEIQEKKWKAHLRRMRLKFRREVDRIRSEADQYEGQMEYVVGKLNREQSASKIQRAYRNYRDRSQPSLQEGSPSDGKRMVTARGDASSDEDDYDDDLLSGDDEPQTRAKKGPSKPVRSELWKRMQFLFMCHILRNSYHRRRWAVTLLEGPIKRYLLRQRDDAASTIQREFRLYRERSMDKQELRQFVRSSLVDDIKSEVRKTDDKAASGTKTPGDTSKPSKPKARTAAKPSREAKGAVKVSKKQEKANEKVVALMSDPLFEVKYLRRQMEKMKLKHERERLELLKKIEVNQQAYLETRAEARKLVLEKSLNNPMEVLRKIDDIDSKREGIVQNQGEAHGDNSVPPGVSDASNAPPPGAVSHAGHAGATGKQAGGAENAQVAERHDPYAGSSVPLTPPLRGQDSPMEEDLLPVAMPRAALKPTVRHGHTATNAIPNTFNWRYVVVILVEDEMELWKMNPIEMKDAVDVFSGIYLEELDNQNGVDRFTRPASMVRYAMFRRLSQAIKFAFCMQTRMLFAKWPPAVSRRVRDPFSGYLLFKGLRLQCAVHHLNPTVDNLNIEQFEVEAAAAMAHVAYGGQVIVSEYVMDLIQSAKEKRFLVDPKATIIDPDEKKTGPRPPKKEPDSWYDVLERECGGLCLKDLGEHFLKPVHQRVFLYQLLPELIRDRMFPLITKRPDVVQNLYQQMFYERIGERKQRNELISRLRDQSQRPMNQLCLVMTETKTLQGLWDRACASSQTSADAAAEGKLGSDTEEEDTGDREMRESEDEKKDTYLNPVSYLDVFSALKEYVKIIYRTCKLCNGVVITSCSYADVCSSPSTIVMVFHHTVDAMQFALSCQDALLKGDWPESVQQTAHSYNDTSILLFHGMRVSMAVHRGESLRLARRKSIMPTISTAPSDVNAFSDENGPLGDTEAQKQWEQTKEEEYKNTYGNENDDQVMVVGEVVPECLAILNVAQPGQVLASETIVEPTRMCTRDLRFPMWKELGIVTLFNGVDWPMKILTLFEVTPHHLSQRQFERHALVIPPSEYNTASLTIGAHDDEFPYGSGLSGPELRKFNIAVSNLGRRYPDLISFVSPPNRFLSPDELSLASEIDVSSDHFLKVCGSKRWTMTFSFYRELDLVHSCQYYDIKGHPKLLFDDSAGANDSDDELMQSGEGLLSANTDNNSLNVVGAQDGSRSNLSAFKKRVKERANRERQEIMEKKRPSAFFVVLRIHVHDEDWREQSVQTVAALEEAYRILTKCAGEDGGMEAMRTESHAMFVFHTAVAAVSFCLRVQVELNDGSWPTEMLNPLYDEQERAEIENKARVARKFAGDDTDVTGAGSYQHALLFRGLRVSMVVHGGRGWSRLENRTTIPDRSSREFKGEEGPMAGRAAGHKILKGKAMYCGPTVDETNYILSLIPFENGGQVVITKYVWTLIAFQLSRLRNPVWRDLGPVCYQDSRMMAHYMENLRHVYEKASLAGVMDALGSKSSAPPGAQATKEEGVAGVTPRATGAETGGEPGDTGVATHLQELPNNRGNAAVGETPAVSLHLYQLLPNSLKKRKFKRIKSEDERRGLERLNFYRQWIIRACYPSRMLAREEWRVYGYEDDNTSSNLHGMSLVSVRAEQYIRVLEHLRRSSMQLKDSDVWRLHKDLLYYCAKHNGFVIEALDGKYMCAFLSAHDAVNFAAQCQQHVILLLRNENEVDDAYQSIGGDLGLRHAVRLRIGVHYCSDWTALQSDYRFARTLARCAGGGQILLSTSFTTRICYRPHSPDPWDLDDLEFEITHRLTRIAFRVSRVGRFHLVGRQFEESLYQLYPAMAVGIEGVKLAVLSDGMKMKKRLVMQELRAQTYAQNEMDMAGLAHTKYSFAHLDVIPLPKKGSEVGEVGEGEHDNKNVTPLVMQNDGIPGVSAMHATPQHRMQRMDSSTFSGVAEDVGRGQLPHNDIMVVGVMNRAGFLWEKDPQRMAEVYTDYMAIYRNMILKSSGMAFSPSDVLSVHDLTVTVFEQLVEAIQFANRLMHQFYKRMRSNAAHTMYTLSLVICTGQWNYECPYRESTFRNGRLETAYKIALGAPDWHIWLPEESRSTIARLVTGDLYIVDLPGDIWLKGLRRPQRAVCVAPKSLFMDPNKTEKETRLLRTSNKDLELDQLPSYHTSSSQLMYKTRAVSWNKLLVEEENVRSLRKLTTTAAHYTIVGVDVEEDNVLWHAYPEDMMTATRMYFEQVYKMVLEYDGAVLEVRNERFVIVFRDEFVALRFAMRVQQSMLSLKWPESLELMNKKRHVYDKSNRRLSVISVESGMSTKRKRLADESVLIFNGLRVKVTVHKLVEPASIQKYPRIESIVTQRSAQKATDIPGKLLALAGSVDERDHNPFSWFHGYESSYGFEIELLHNVLDSTFGGQTMATAVTFSRLFRASELVHQGESTLSTETSIPFAEIDEKCLYEVDKKLQMRIRWPQQRHERERWMDIGLFDIVPETLKFREFPPTHPGVLDPIYDRVRWRYRRLLQSKALHPFQWSGGNVYALILQLNKSETSQIAKLLERHLNVLIRKFIHEEIAEFDWQCSGHVQELKSSYYNPELLGVVILVGGPDLPRLFMFVRMLMRNILSKFNMYYINQLVQTLESVNVSAGGVPFKLNALITRIESPLVIVPDPKGKDATSGQSKGTGNGADLESDSESTNSVHLSLIYHTDSIPRAHYKLRNFAANTLVCSTDAIDELALRFSNKPEVIVEALGMELGSIARLGEVQFSARDAPPGHFCAVQQYDARGDLIDAHVMSRLTVVLAASKAIREYHDFLARSYRKIYFLHDVPVNTTVYFVVVDIADAQDLWDKYPHDMTEGMAIFRDILLKLVLLDEGHIVRQEGDQHVAVFSTVFQAVDFALRVQDRMMDSKHMKWPEPLVAEETCPHTKQLLYRGPKIRSIVHNGTLYRQYYHGMSTTISFYDRLRKGRMHRRRNLKNPDDVVDIVAKRMTKALGVTGTEADDGKTLGEGVVVDADTNRQAVKGHDAQRPVVSGQLSGGDGKAPGQHMIAGGESQVDKDAILGNAEENISYQEFQGNLVSMEQHDSHTSSRGIRYVSVELREAQFMVQHIAGGQVALTQDVWSITFPLLHRLGRPIYRELGVMRFPEMDREVILYELLPERLRSRTFPKVSGSMDTVLAAEISTKRNDLESQIHQREQQLEMQQQKMRLQKQMADFNMKVTDEHNATLIATSLTGNAASDKAALETATQMQEVLTRLTQLRTQYLNYIQHLEQAKPRDLPKSRHMSVELQQQEAENKEMDTEFRKTMRDGLENTYHRIVKNLQKVTKAYADSLADAQRMIQGASRVEIIREDGREAPVQDFNNTTGVGGMNGTVPGGGLPGITNRDDEDFMATKTTMRSGVYPDGRPRVLIKDPLALLEQYPIQPIARMEMTGASLPPTGMSSLHPYTMKASHKSRTQENEALRASYPRVGKSHAKPPVKVVGYSPSPSPALVNHPGNRKGAGHPRSQSTPPIFDREYKHLEAMRKETEKWQQVQYYMEHGHPYHKAGEPADSAKGKRSTSTKPDRRLRQALPPMNASMDSSGPDGVAGFALAQTEDELEDIRQLQRQARKL